MNPNPNPVALLEQLRDVHDPAFPGIWPLAPGWWLLALLALVVLCLVARWLVRRLRLRRYRHSVLALFDGLGRSDIAVTDPSQFAAEVSALLRRVALTRFPRQQVAALEGSAWLDFLDRTGGSGRFSQGPGQVLAEGPYRPQPELDPHGVLAVAKDWVRRNS